MAIVTLENVTKRFGETVILRDVNLTVEKGQIIPSRELPVEYHLNTGYSLLIAN